MRTTEITGVGLVEAAGVDVLVETVEVGFAIFRDS
jgi:hypothetical protein